METKSSSTTFTGNPQVVQPSPTTNPRQHPQQYPKTLIDAGRKDDANKLPYDLLPSDAIEEILEVLKCGAVKYGSRNWENGMAWSRPFAALMRHMWAWWRREPCDNETGITHLAHAGCCLLFLLSYELRRTGSDDRP